MGEKKNENPTVWFSWKKSFNCKSETPEVSNPKTRKQLAEILTKKTSRSGCSRSIANLKDVIHSSRRHFDRPPSCSPRSIGSSEFLNPITHEVILNNSKCELKISSFGGFHESGGGSTFVGTLTPGTPGPKGHPTMNYFNPSYRTPPRKNGSILAEREASGGGIGFHSKRRASVDKDVNGFSIVTCHKCGGQFLNWDALESHHLSKHAVTELLEGDSSRKIVEIICRSNYLKTENNNVRIERILKVHNMQKTLALFEEHREMVKLKASKLAKKHPRCLADGNELLRFYGTTLGCTLGFNGSSSLCISDKCCVCRVIRHGFSSKREIRDGVGVFTSSTSGRAFECIENLGDDLSSRKALIVCRVIAGRVHRPLENVQDIIGQTGFDSLAGKVGLHSNIEELYLLNSRALLPCFVVICRT